MILHGHRHMPLACLQQPPDHSNSNICIMTTNEAKEDELPQFPTGRTVPFPYKTPYPQQVDLMDAILQSLQARRQHSSKAALYFLESPTGTGKSLSIAAATLAWWQYQEQVDLQAQQAPAVSSDQAWWDTWEAPEVRQARDNANRVRQQARTARQELTARLATLRRQGTSLADRQRALRQALQVQPSNPRKRPHNHQNTSSKSDDFALLDYQSDHDENRRGVRLAYENEHDSTDPPKNFRHKKLSPDARLLDPARLDGSAAGFADLPSIAVGDVLPGTGVRKIVYAARTHSQLSQFAREVSRLPGGDSVRLVALGGRKALCGNADLRRRHPNERDLNEACLDLQKGTSSTGSQRGQEKSGCPLLASRDNLATLSLHLLTQPTDIEEAAAMGESSQTCAYYASRQSLAAAQVVVLPYSMLLSDCTRQAVGLSLKESLVIVDEAHNLPEALRAIHSSQLSLTVVRAALGQLGRYVQKYQDRLAGRNLVYLGQLRKTLLTFQKHLQKPPDKEWEQMLSVEVFLTKLRLQHTNFFKLMRYLETSRLSQKLLGFMNKEVQGETKENGAEKAKDELSKHVSAMSIVETFLEKLTTTNSEGKFVFEKAFGSSSAAFRYVLLDPATFLEPILNQAHAVALVGGTLRPFAHVATELVGNKLLQISAGEADQALAEKPVTTDSYKQIDDGFTAFSCGHVVSSERVFLRCLAAGPNGQKLDFRHANRGKSIIMDELGASLKRIVQSVPRGGTVVFVGSYSYEAELVQRWKSQGIWNDLQKLVPVFREPTKSRDVDRTLKDYSRCAGSKGALLMSVIGGKMSEGINFSNDMARCVVIVGLPYPDITDPVLKEKMAALDRNSMVGISGRSYYRNLCMRAVNQSVGRAIRHAKDYAAIILLDERYTTDESVWSALPTWLTRSSNASRKGSFTECESALQTFFRSFPPNE